MLNWILAPLFTLLMKAERSLSNKSQQNGNDNRKGKFEILLEEQFPNWWNFLISSISVICFITEISFQYIVDEDRPGSSTHQSTTNITCSWHWAVSPSGSISLFSFLEQQLLPALIWRSNSNTAAWPINSFLGGNFPSNQWRSILKTKWMKKQNEDFLFPSMANLYAYRKRANPNGIFTGPRYHYQRGER